MTNARWIMLAMVALPGCPVDSHQVGPTAHVLLDDFSQVKDTDTAPVLQLVGRTAYSIAMEVDVLDGTDDDPKMKGSFPSMSMTATVTVPGVTIADSAFTPHDIVDEMDYNRDSKITIPASAMGSTLTVHAQAMDSRGLQSNVVEFTVALQ